MKEYTWLETLQIRLLYPGIYRRVIGEYLSLKKSRFYDRAEMQQLQSKKLGNLLSHARSNLDHWNVALKSVSFSNSVSETLAQITVSRKTDYKNLGAKAWSSHSTKYHQSTTGGTTGTPLTIRKDLDTVAVALAALWRAKSAWGISPRDKEVFLKVFGNPTLKGQIRMALLNKRIIPAFPNSSQEADQALRSIRSFNPRAIEGYPTGLLQVLKSKGHYPNLQVPIIISTGEMLYEHQRKELEDGFGANLYSYYGSNEIGAIAFECEQKSLHVCEEHVFVEVLNNHDQPVTDEVGRIVITDLDNQAMPFIRYEIGDRASISEIPCSCGRASRVISQLEGRSQDYLTNSSGIILSATQLAGTLRSLSHIGDIQFRQIDQGPVEIHYTGNPNLAEDELNEIEKLIKNRLGVDHSLEFKPVKSISKTKRGKQPLIKRSS